MTIVYKCLSYVIILFTISACGFHLRGQNVVPPGLNCLKLDSIKPYGDFESTLWRSLVRLGINVTRTGQAPVTLHIINTVLYQDVPTIGGSNQAHVYVYYYQVIFEVINANHDVLIPATTVKTSETLFVNAGTVLESTDQLEILKQQMQKEAAHMILNILNTQLR